MTLAFKARVNDPAIASFRYRVLKPIEFLGARGQAVELYDEARFDQYETVVFSKTYKADDQALARRLKDAGKKVVLDLCDDHFFNPEDVPKYRQARTDLLAMIALCDRVICSTPVLARTVQEEAGLAETPAVAPDAYEQASVEAGPPTAVNQPAKLLWFGRHGSPNAPAGMGDLLLIRTVLQKARRLRKFTLVVCSDSRERYDELFKDFPVDTAYVRWTPEAFARELQAADAVLIPLSENRFVAAKTHNRLSLALSAGVPVVADKLDSYAEFAPFCYLGKWRAGLETVLTRPHDARKRAARARPYLEARWSESAVAPLWETALGLPPPAENPDQIRIETDGAPPLVQAWLARDGRPERPWLLAGPDAIPEAIARARARGCLVMSLGVAAARIKADLAYVIDAELLARSGEKIATNSQMVLTPSDLHSHGWASGRSLESWAVDIPVLRRLRDEERLLRFELWTGSPEGLMGEIEGPEIPLRLLAQAGVRQAWTTRTAPPMPSVSGFEALSSTLERVSGGLAALASEDRIAWGAFEDA